MSERKEKFTPGPWRVESQQDGNECPRWAVKAGSVGDWFGHELFRHIATGGYTSPLVEGDCDAEALAHEDRANAHLLAAVPELYEALTEAVKTIDRLNDALAETNTWSDRNWDRVDNSAMRHKAILAKAQGGA